jgi:hypothetical protein
MAMMMTKLIHPQLKRRTTNQETFQRDSFYRCSSPQTEGKLKKLLRFKGTCKAHSKRTRNRSANKEMKLFKCRLRNVHTIYQDFHTEIIIMSIYELFCCLLIFLRSIFAPRILETAAEKGATESE